MDTATEAVAEFIRGQVGVDESELIDVQAVELIDHLEERGFRVVGHAEEDRLRCAIEDHMRDVIFAADDSGVKHDADEKLWAALRTA